MIHEWHVKFSHVNWIQTVALNKICEWIDKIKKPCKLHTDAGITYGTLKSRVSIKDRQKKNHFFLKVLKNVTFMEIYLEDPVWPWNVLYFLQIQTCRKRLTCLKGCGMGTLFVLVSPCFRENVVVTCKILDSFDNLLQKNVIVFFFGN